MALIKSGMEFDKVRHRANMRKRMLMMDVRRTTVRIPAKIYHQFQLKLLQNNMKMSDYFNAMILKYLGNPENDET